MTWMYWKPWKIHVGALPLLEHFEIRPSPQLEKVPFGIRLLKILTSIDFWGMSKEFTNKILPKNGQNYHIVEHVPNVFFQFFHAIGYNTKALRWPPKISFQILGEFIANFHAFLVGMKLTSKLNQNLAGLT